MTAGSPRQLRAWAAPLQLPPRDPLGASPAGDPSAGPESGAPGLPVAPALLPGAGSDRGLLSDRGRSRWCQSEPSWHVGGSEGADTAWRGGACSRVPGAPQDRAKEVTATSGAPDLGPGGLKGLSSTPAHPPTRMSDEGSPPMVA